MQITVIIPTTNEPTLEAVIQATKSELPEAEILVVGFGESGVIARRNLVGFIDMLKRTPKPIGINRAVHLANNEWLVILDADAIPQKGWGNSMLTAFRQGKELFHGSIDISQGNYWMKGYNLSMCHEYLPENNSSQRKYLSAVNLGFTKSAFLKAGDWDEGLTRSQDYEWTLRMFKMGIIPWFIPEACVVHIPINQRTFKSVWNAWVRSGYYNWVIRNKFPDVLKTPKLLKYPLLILLFAPILSLFPTLRISKTSPKNFLRSFYLLPVVYMTKIAWCWGVYTANMKYK
jgi:GT2 family glycosyltransferase